jgi:hypothetical protein
MLVLTLAMVLTLIASAAGIAIWLLKRLFRAMARFGGEPDSVAKPRASRSGSQWDVDHPSYWKRAGQ